MKKSTIAVAALLTALSTAPVMSVAYADDAAAPVASCKGADACKGCKGCKGDAGCKGEAGCKGAAGCSGD